MPARYPARLTEFIGRCHEQGQERPTPLVLKYGPGDYNRLHQDLYGEVAFPLQLAIVLSRPGKDFAGGEFVLTEQRPRMQSQVHVVSLAQGDGVVFANRFRPTAQRARLQPGQRAPWRQPGFQGRAFLPGHYFPRRRLTCRHGFVMIGRWATSTTTIMTMTTS